MPLTEKDRLLINNLLSGKSGAWGTFVDRYAGLIVQVLRHTAHAHSLTLSAEDTEDLTADVFSTLLERNMGAIRAFRGQSSFATYLTVIVRRVLLRKLTQRRYFAAFGHVRVHQASVTEIADDAALEQVDVRDEAESLMSRVPDQVRSMLRLLADGSTYEDVSRKLGIPVNSIGPALSRAKQSLRRRAETG
ncbi:MAG: sigma-70 family RNA polymerase sigma factor [Planctomycetaceae bacterium]|nr:sigma-70 family RNA polymerase sigma factor [Planctomycetaceae bacterium]